VSPYREPADVAEQIPRRSSWRLALAVAIVAPVRIFWWCWPWLAANIALNFALIPAYAEHPRGTAALAVGVNLLTGIGYGARAAYRWAKREIRSALPESDGDAG
jgi:hypothetical protein